MLVALIDKALDIVANLLHLAQAIVLVSPFVGWYPCVNLRI